MKRFFRLCPSSRRLSAALAVLGLLAGLAILVLPVEAAFDDHPILALQPFSPGLAGAVTEVDCGVAVGNLGRRADGLSLYNLALDDACRVAASRRAFTTNDGGSLTQIDIADLSNPAAPVLVATFDLSPYGDTVQSVATRNGVVAAAVAPADPLAKGAVVLFTTAGSLLGAVPTGYLPDSVTFTPDGTKVLSADEGQPSCSGSTVVDVPGSVTIIDVASLTSSTATFTAADVVSGVRVNLPTPDADELEPEYIVILPDSRTAYVTLQENNAIATVDIATADVTSVAPLGAKDHNVAGQGLDPSDRDNAAGTCGVIAIVNRPVLGLPMPDGIASLTQGATTYLLTANEGDAREYPPCFARDDEPEQPHARPDGLPHRHDAEGQRARRHRPATGVAYRRRPGWGRRPRPAVHIRNPIHVGVPSGRRPGGRHR